MNKQEFLDCLRRELAGMPESELAERLSFYRDMIDDRVEDGLTEEAAVAEIGPVEAIVAQIAAEAPPPLPEPEPAQPKRRLRPGEIVLLVLGFPLWFPLLIAAAVIVLALLIVLWALILSLWAVELSLIAGALAGVCLGALSFFRGERLEGLAVFGAGLVLAGLSILLVYACRAATRGAAALTKRTVTGIVSLFHRKETTA